MSFWQLILSLLDFAWYVDRWLWTLRHWRLTVSFWAGVALGVGILLGVPWQPVNRVLGALAFALCLAGGWIWDDRAGL
jgi:hypothetical protein